MKKLLSNTLYPIITILEDEIDGTNTADLNLVISFCADLTDIFLDRDTVSQEEFAASDLGIAFFELVEDKIIKHYETSTEESSDNLKRFCELIALNASLTQDEFDLFNRNLNSYFKEQIQKMIDEENESSQPLTIGYLLNYPSTRNIPMSTLLSTEDSNGNSFGFTTIDKICWDNKTKFQFGKASYERSFSIDAFYSPEIHHSTATSELLTFESLKKLVEKYAIPEDTVVFLKENISEEPYEMFVSDVYLMEENDHGYDKTCVVLSKSED